MSNQLKSQLVLMIIISFYSMVLSARFLIKCYEPLVKDEINEEERMMAVQCVKAFCRYNLSDERVMWSNNVTNYVKCRFCAPVDFHMFSHKYADYKIDIFPVRIFSGYNSISNRYIAVGHTITNNTDCAFTVFMNLDTGLIDPKVSSHKCLFVSTDQAIPKEYFFSQSYYSNAAELRQRLRFKEFSQLELRELGFNPPTTKEVEVRFDDLDVESRNALGNHTP